MISEAVRRFDLYCKEKEFDRYLQKELPDESEVDGEYLFRESENNRLYRITLLVSVETSDFERGDGGIKKDEEVVAEEKKEIIYSYAFDAMTALIAARHVWERHYYSIKLIDKISVEEVEADMLVLTKTPATREFEQTP